MGVSREDLYKEVWAEPMTTVAARYEVSSSYLARVCADLGVPRPERGYWAKREFGKDVRQTPLPEPAPGTALEWSRDGSPPTRALPLPEPPAERRGARRRRTLEDGDPSQHSLLAHVEEHFAATRFNDVGHMRPTKRLLPDIFVTKELQATAVAAANRLFKHLERAGYEVMLAPKDQHYDRPALDYRDAPVGQLMEYYTWSPARPTVVFVGTVAIGLTIYELSEHVEVRYVNGKYVRVADAPARRRSGHEWIHKRDMPTGRLAIRVYSPYPGTTWLQAWQEKEPGAFAGLLDGIERAVRRAAPMVAGLVAEARERARIQHEKWQEEHREWERREAERQKVEDARQLSEARAASRSELLKTIETWALAARVEAFFADASRRADGLPENERMSVHNQIGRARALVGDLDTLARFRSWRAPDDLDPGTEPEN